MTLLADPSLGKTVQSICTLAHLAEAENIWGPFMVISPLSTLTNWHAEFEKFAVHRREEKESAGAVENIRALESAAKLLETAKPKAKRKKKGEE